MPLGAAVLMFVAAQPNVAEAVKNSCRESTASEVVVCAEPDQRSRYRIDPAIAAVQQQAEDRGTSTSLPWDLGTDPCPPHGIKLCPGMDTIPVLAIARVAARSALLAANGEDWRAPLRTQADQYELYREAKAKEERRKSDRKVRFGVFNRSRGR